MFIRVFSIIDYETIEVVGIVEPFTRDPSDPPWRDSPDDGNELKRASPLERPFSRKTVFEHGRFRVQSARPPLFSAPAGGSGNVFSK